MSAVHQERMPQCIRSNDCCASGGDAQAPLHPTPRPIASYPRRSNCLPHDLRAHTLPPTSQGMPSSPMPLPQPHLLAAERPPHLPSQHGSHNVLLLGRQRCRLCCRCAAARPAGLAAVGDRRRPHHALHFQGRPAGGACPPCCRACCRASRRQFGQAAVRQALGFDAGALGHPAALAAARQGGCAGCAGTVVKPAAPSLRFAPAGGGTQRCCGRHSRRRGLAGAAAVWHVDGGLEGVSGKGGGESGPALLRIKWVRLQVGDIQEGSV